MSIEYFLFVIYVAGCFWLIPKISFIRNANLTTLEIRALLALKIFSGMAGAFYFSRIASFSDYVSFNEVGKIEYRLLLSNPRIFFTDLNGAVNSNGLGGLFDTQNSFWADLRFNLLHKFIALLNLLTRGNFYFNTLIFCSFLFFGHIAFYRIYSEIYKDNKRAILAACFFLPSLLLYTACIHKDGIIFLCLAIISYVFYRILLSGTLHFKDGLLLMMGMTGIFLFRNFVVVAILPAMLTALLCKLLPYKKRIVVPVTYLFFFLLFFLSGFSKSVFNLPEAVVQRQADFALLKEGTTSIPLNRLSPDAGSFLVNLPQAANHYLLRPYLWEFRQLPIFLTALELFVYQLLIIAFVFFRKRQPTPPNVFNIYGLLLLFNMILIIGYTIPNIGAIVRYRSIFWMFLVCPLAGSIDWKRLPYFRSVSNKIR